MASARESRGSPHRDNTNLGNDINDNNHDSFFVSTRQAGKVPSRLQSYTVDGPVSNRIEKEARSETDTEALHSDPANVATEVPEEVDISDSKDKITLMKNFRC